MTTKKAKPGKPGPTSPALIVFGLSEIGKPRAGTFGQGDIEAATKAAGALGLSVFKVKGPAAADIASKIPSGRVHANGAGFVPFIRQALYDDLTAVAKAHGVKIADTVANGNANSSPAAAPANTKSGPAPRLPKSWDDIAVGDLVLSQDTDPKEGWWQALVVRKAGEMVSLRWQHSSTRRVFTKHTFNLGLIWPGHDRNVKPIDIKDPVPMYPVSWATIGLTALVLAKEDGPMEQWWEAHPIEADGDSFTLRWRDYPALPNIVRPRLAVALIHPNPAGASAKGTAAA
jgi:hypothetical protein